MHKPLTKQETDDLRKGYADPNRKQLSTGHELTIEAYLGLDNEHTNRSK